MPISSTDNLGDRIRFARKNKKVTQDQLASFLNINRATLSKYEKGIIIPPMPKLRAISEYLEISFSYLLGDNQTIDEAKDNYNYEMMFISIAEETDKILDILFPGTNTYVIAGDNHEEIVTIRGRNTTSPFVLSRENFDFLSHLIITLVKGFVDGTGQNPITYIAELKEYVDSIEPIPHTNQPENADNFKTIMANIDKEDAEIKQQQEAYYKYVIENCEYDDPNLLN